MTHGGARAGSGRKSNGEILRFRALIDRAMTDEDWVEIVKAAVLDAKGHDRAAGFARQWLAENRFGVPTQPIDVVSDVQQITVIRYEGHNLSDENTSADEKELSAGEDAERGFGDELPQRTNARGAKQGAVRGNSRRNAKR